MSMLTICPHLWPNQNESSTFSPSSMGLGNDGSTSALFQHLICMNGNAFWGHDMIPYLCRSRHKGPYTRLDQFSVDVIKTKWLSSTSITPPFQTVIFYALNVVEGMVPSGLVLALSCSGSKHDLCTILYSVWDSGARRDLPFLWCWFILEEVWQLLWWSDESHRRHLSLIVKQIMMRYQGLIPPEFSTKPCLMVCWINWQAIPIRPVSKRLDTMIQLTCELSRTSPRPAIKSVTPHSISPIPIASMWGRAVITIVAWEGIRYDLFCNTSCASPSIWWRIIRITILAQDLINNATLPTTSSTHNDEGGNWVPVGISWLRRLGKIMVLLPCSVCSFLIMSWALESSVNLKEPVMVSESCLLYWFSLDHVRTA